jgi:hypothetical protein
MRLSAIASAGRSKTMFGNLKTKGFALEATHLTDPNKLHTLLALLAIAVALTVKTGVARAQLHTIPIKNPRPPTWVPTAVAREARAGRAVYCGVILAARTKPSQSLTC